MKSIDDNFSGCKKPSELYSELYENAPASYFSVNTDGIILKANMNAANMLGYEMNKLIGMPVFNLYADNPSGKERAKKVFDKFKAGNKIINEELQMQKADCKTFWISLTLHPQFDANGNINYCRSMVVDITKQKNVEDELRKKIKTNELLMDAIPHPAMLILKDRTIVAANKIARDFGARVGGLCWKEFLQGNFIPEKDKKYINDHKEVPPHGTHCTFCLADESMNEKGESKKLEITAFGKILDSYWIPIDDDMFLHYALDITDRKELEKREKELMQKNLIHTDRLLTLGQFAAGMAHELNEPIGNILGFAELSKKDPGLSDKTIKDVDSIIEASLHAREIIKNLITFSRKAPTVKTLSNINEIAEEGLILFKNLCVREEIEIKKDFDPKLPDIRFDRTQMRQIFVNTIKNAIESMEDGGELVLKTCLLDDKIQIVIKDSGCGMSKDTLEKVFDPFFTTKGVGDGTGLGLSVVHGIVANHNGSIDINSMPNKGTEISISFSCPRKKKLKISKNKDDKIL